MLIIPFILLIGGFLQVIYLPFAAINNLLPTQITTSITTLISYLNYFNGIFPVDVLLNCIAILIGFYMALYTVKLALFIYALLPFIGRTVELPTIRDRMWQQRLDNAQVSRWHRFVKKRGGKI